MTKLFESPDITLRLKRFPAHDRQPLQAWDAADEYLLETLHEEQALSETSRVLILNDSFGALGLALHSHQPVWVTDSCLSMQALEENAERNSMSLDSLTVQTSLDTLTGSFDVVLIRIPKNLAMLEHQLHELRGHLQPNSVIVGAAMARHIHSSTLARFETLIGPTRTSLARKKARLIFASLDPSLEPGLSPYPSHYTLEASGERYLNHANLFSRDKLDIGSRFLLEHVPESERYRRIIDMGCGNGVLGIAAARLNPHAYISFADESHMAVASARHNVHSALKEAQSDRFDFHVTDCLTGLADQSADLILNNPPFHQHHAVGDFIARQMFADAHRTLRAEGELWVVANRHLAHHITLKRLFGNCKTVAENRKFVILKATRT